MGIGDFISGIFGSKNRAKATAPTVDANAYEYGGGPQGAANAALRYQQAGANAQNRQAAQANYGQADADRAMNLQARSQLGAVGNMQLARAMGQTPSIAGQQAGMDMQRAQAAQMAGAASARGAAGIALAQQNAANNTANAMGQISGQAQVNAANERMAAENAAANTFGMVRGQDLSSQGQSAQQAQYNAGLQAQQRAQNDAFQLGMTGFETGVQQAQLAAQQNRQAQQSSNAMGAQSINAGVAGQNASMNQANAVGFVGMLQNAAGAAAGAAGKADGGPIARGQRVVVGERGPEEVRGPNGGFMVGMNGPELIVPKEDGYVVPNHALGINPTGRERPPPSPAQTVISTWGRGQAMTPEEGQRYMAPEQERAAQVNRAVDRGANPSPTSGGMAIVNPLSDLRQQDEEKVSQARIYDEYGIERSERDQYDSDAAERRLAREAKGRRGAPKPTLSSRLSKGGDEAMKAASHVDTAYHGYGGYQAPHLIPVMARAMGGPIGAGMPTLVGEQGPEMVQPYSGVGQVAGLQQISGPRAPAIAAPVASATFAGAGGLAGGSVAGEDRAHKAFGARFARNPMAYGDADGGPMKAGENHVVGERGPEEVVPLGNPMPGVNLHVGDDGRAFYQHDVSVDDNRPRIESRPGGGADAKAKAPELAKAPTQAAAPPKTRKMTDAELLAEADRQIASIKSQEASSMAAGPAVRMPVAINKVAKRYAIANIVPPARKRQAVASEGEAYPIAPHPHDLPPPKPPPIEATEAPDQFEDSAMEQAIYDYARTMQGQGLGRNSYDIARMMRSFPEGPSFASKMREAKGRR